ncbi:MAG: hypothetical protein ACYDC2_01190 [Solirubrobacteraceae bacterium]
MSLAGCVAITVFVGSAASASGQIVVGQGIAGARIGDSVSQVEAVLGKPTTPLTEHGELFYSSLGYVGFQAGTEGHEHVTSGVTYVETFSRAQRTPAGVGPGTPYARLHGKYPHYRCDREHGPKSPLRACWTRTRSGGQSVTTAFYFDGEPKVAFVVVAGQSFQLRAKLAI